MSGPVTSVARVLLEDAVCYSNPSMRQCIVKGIPNITVIVAWGSVQLIHNVSTVMFQLWRKPLSEHVQECFAIHGSNVFERPCIYRTLAFFRISYGMYRSFDIAFIK